MEEVRHKEGNSNLATELSLYKVNLSLRVFQQNAENLWRHSFSIDYFRTRFKCNIPSRRQSLYGKREASWIRHYNRIVFQKRSNLITFQSALLSWKEFWWMRRQGNIFQIVLIRTIFSLMWGTTLKWWGSGNITDMRKSKIAGCIIRVNSLRLGANQGSRRRLCSLFFGNYSRYKFVLTDKRDKSFDHALNFIFHPIVFCR